MPPKKPSVRQDKIKGNASCTGRDITPLQNYVLNTDQGRGYLANLLEQEGYLDEYRLQPILNECEFSFASSDWFGVYLLDSAGSKYWLDGNNKKQPYVYYFKIIPSPEGGLMIDESTHRFSMPPELVGVKRCIINEKGKCGVETIATPPKAPKEPKAPSPPKATRESKGKSPLVTPPSAVSATLPEDVRLLVESLKISAPARSEADPSSKPGREAMEKMDLKTLMNWVSVHMYPEDLLRCVRSGKLSEQDKADLDTLEGSIPSGSGGFSAEDLEAVRMAETLPPSKLFSMLKKITSSDIMADINKLKGESRQRRIIDLCNETNLGYTKRPYKGSVSIFGPDNERVTDTEALTQCASVRAIQMRSKMQEGFARAGSRASIAKTLTPIFKAPSTAPKMSSTQASKLADIIDDMLGAKAEGDLESIVVFAKSVHYDNIGISADGKTLTESGRPLNDEDVEEIIDQMALAYIKQNNVAFGKRKRAKKAKSGKRGKRAKSDKKSKSVKIFTLSAKHCKGKSNYRACMSKTLKKMHRKSSFGRKKTRKTCKPAGKSLTRRKVINNFKCAVRKCKKSKSGYITCMSKTLKKIYRKSSFGDIKGNIKNFVNDVKTVLLSSDTKNQLLALIKQTKLKDFNAIKQFFYDKINPLFLKHFGSIDSLIDEICPLVVSQLTPIINKLLMEGAKKAGAYMVIAIPAAKIFPTTKLLNYLCNKMVLSLKEKIKKKLEIKFGKQKVIKRKTSKRKVVKRKTSKRKVVKRKTSKRKSPRISATSVPLGTVKQGVNGYMWKTRKTKNGVKRWFKI